MFAVADGPLTATLPASWNLEDVSAVSLSPEGKTPARIQRDGRRITVQMRSRQPVMLHRQI